MVQEFKSFYEKKGIHLTDERLVIYKAQFEILQQIKQGMQIDDFAEAKIALIFRPGIGDSKNE